LRRLTKEWHQRSKGSTPKYNDNKWVVFVSYNVLLGMSLLILFNCLTFSDPWNRLFCTNLTLIIATITNISLYIVPKLFRTHLACASLMGQLSLLLRTTSNDNTRNLSGEKPKPDTDFDSASTLTPWRYLIIDRENKDNVHQDVELIKEYLRPFGFALVQDAVASRSKFHLVPTKTSPDPSHVAVETWETNDSGGNREVEMHSKIAPGKTPVDDSFRPIDSVPETHERTTVNKQTKKNHSCLLVDPNVFYYLLPNKYFHCRSQTNLNELKYAEYIQIVSVLEGNFRLIYSFLDLEISGKLKNAFFCSIK
ncbi:hypothetical protein RFI_02341, partial [Reticulomyxa filosa]